MNKTILELISRRRRQMIVHSIIYYRHCTSLIEDSTFDKWARELVKLQRDYPEEAEIAPYAELFNDWDGTTGFRLLDSEWGYDVAERLMKKSKIKYK